jgi:hypothetical protein
VTFAQPFSHRHPELVSGSISRFARRNGWQTQPHRQISPMRVMLVDQVDLPRPMPVLELLLTHNCWFHLAKHLKMDQAINRIFGGKAGKGFVAVLPQAGDQVRRHANVKRTIGFARKNINTGLTFLSHGRSLAAKWTLKQVQGDGLFGGDGFSNKSHRSTQRHPESPQRHPELVSGSIGRFIQFWRLALKRAAK